MLYIYPFQIKEMMFVFIYVFMFLYIQTLNIPRLSKQVDLHSSHVTIDCSRRETLPYVI